MVVNQAPHLALRLPLRHTAGPIEGRSTVRNSPASQYDGPPDFLAIPRTGAIILTRHGEPALSRKCRLSAREYGEWWGRDEVDGLRAGLFEVWRAALCTPQALPLSLLANAPGALPKGLMPERETMPSRSRPSRWCNFPDGLRS